MTDVYSNNLKRIIELESRWNYLTISIVFSGPSIPERCICVFITGLVVLDFQGSCKTERRNSVECSCLILARYYIFNSTSSCHFSHFCLLIKEFNHPKHILKSCLTKLDYFFLIFLFSCFFIIMLVTILITF